jgi:hypothetical protein
MEKKDYVKNIVTKPVYEIGRGIAVKGRLIPSMTDRKSTRLNSSH